MTDDLITVIDVARSLRRSLSKDEAWSIGAQVARRWRADHSGEAPPLGYRKKTYGGGSHPFALYPESFRPVIEGIISRVQATRSAQKDLFG